MNCKDEREIVAHGLCAKCYMRHKRNEEASDDPYGIFGARSERRYIAERNKMLVNLTRIIKLVDETPCLTHEDATTIKVTIQPYLLERANALAPIKSQPELTVNTKSESTVNSNGHAAAAEASLLMVNTDPGLTVNPDSEPNTDPEPPAPRPPRVRQQRANIKTRKDVASSAIPKFRYQGSKGRLARRIARMLPPSGRRYVEPFAGRGNVYFAVAQLLDYEFFWLNDTSTWQFFCDLRLGMGCLNVSWAIPEFSDAEFEKFKALHAEWEALEKLDWDEIFRGLDIRDVEETFTQMQAEGETVKIDVSPHVMEPYLCYSGGIYEKGSRSAGPKAVSREGYENSVRLASEIMRRTTPRITSLDYKSVLAQCGPDDVVYLDPPYVKRWVSAYKNIDHTELVELLLGAKFRWLLSDYEDPLYITAFGEPAQRINVQKLLGPQGASGVREIECLWRNF
jgi:D12 class N6 adenine-specific DNA methyltransferase